MGSMPATGQTNTTAVPRQTARPSSLVSSVSLNGSSGSVSYKQPKFSLKNILVVVAFLVTSQNHIGTFHFLSTHPSSPLTDWSDWTLLGCNFCHRGWGGGRFNRNKAIGIGRIRKLPLLESMTCFQVLNTRNYITGSLSPWKRSNHVLLAGWRGVRDSR